MDGPRRDELRAEIDALHEGQVGSPGLVDAFRHSVLLCPTQDREPLAIDQAGITWLVAFTSEAALARWARARGEGGVGWEFARIDGARLLDVAVPALGAPGGVAVDLGGERPLLLPPVRGIVPDGAAVDGVHGGGGGGAGGSAGAASTWNGVGR